MLVVVVLVVVPAVAVATVVIMETCVPALFFRSKLLSCCWSAIRLLRRTQYHLQSIYSMVITRAAIRTFDDDDDIDGNDDGDVDDPDATMMILGTLVCRALEEGRCIISGLYAR